MADLLAVARERLAAEGPAGLSLRAVARELGVASSAVYRYVASRDALLTALVIEAYEEVGEVCERALAEALEAGRTPAEAWLAVGRAFRRYALEHRSSFELVFGTPVPGYAAPPETVAAAARLWFVIARVCAAAAARGELDPVGPPPVKDLMDPEALAMAREHLGEEVALDDALVARAVTLWVSLVGTTCAEVFGHLRGMTHDHPALFELTLATAAVGVGLRLPAS